jgi:ATP-dependent helicase/nuclease subunit A
MTRAKEHLVVCGAGERKPGSWHELVELGLGKIDDDLIERTEAGWGGEVVRFRTGDIGEVRAGTEAQAPSFDAPVWLHERALKESPEVVLYPSEVPEEDTWEGEGLEAVAQGSQDARSIGLYVHSLLERLPAAPKSEREALAERLAEPHRDVLAPDEREAAAKAAHGLIEGGGTRDLFAPGGLAEVAIQGEVDGRFVSGQIDRLLVGEETVTAIEFKSGRWVPTGPEAIPPSHRRQVEIYQTLLRSLYPGREVRGVLVYTAAARVFTKGEGSWSGVENASSLAHEG